MGTVGGCGVGCHGRVLLAGLLLGCAPDRTVIDGGTSSGPASTSTGATSDAGTTGEEAPSEASTDPDSEPGACALDTDCTAPNASFCDGGSGQCMGCSGLSDADARCAAADPGRPLCYFDTCVPCTADAVGACEGTTPVCGPTHLCEPCTEHAQCPDSACHLDGPQAGACFDPADVVWVTDAAALTAALQGIAAADTRVVVLAGETYPDVLAVLPSDSEVALLGQGAQWSAGSRDGLIRVRSGAHLYLAGLSLGENPLGNGIACEGASVWLDDALITGSDGVGVDASAGCGVHLRRSIVRGNAGGGISSDGGLVQASVSAVVSNGDTWSSAFGGLWVTDANLDLRYSTIVSNGASSDVRRGIVCSGVVSGDVRNSVVFGGSSSANGCGAVSFAFSAVDDARLGPTNAVFESFSPAWYAGFGPLDPHLSRVGREALMGIAQWGDGDPTADIDGDPIAADAPSFPGFDQP